MACSSDQTSPSNPPDVPADLFSTTLNGAVALTWPDNAYESDPDNFQSYRIYSTTYDIDAPAGTEPCGTSWTLEGTTVAPEFLVGAMVNGVSRCFSVSSANQTGAESNRSRSVFDTPRPDSRNQVLYPIQVKSDSSGFRFWDDDGDNVVEEGELGRVRNGASSDVDFYVDRDGSGRLFLTPMRTGTGVEFYSEDPVGDLTSIDDAPCLQRARSQHLQQICQHSDRGGARDGLRIRDGGRRSVSPVRCGPGDPCRPRFHDSGLGLPDRSREPGASRGKERGHALTTVD